MRLRGKVALISGASGGMGAAEARLFASEGARVVLGDIIEDAGRDVASEIAATGAEAVFLGLDVTSPSDWEKAVDEAVSRFGGLDVLVNNAGVYLRGSIVNISSFNSLVGTTTSAAYNASKAAVRLLTKSTAVQYAGDGIRANVIHPGPTRTAMFMSGFPDEEAVEERRALVPLGRIGTPEDVAYGALFLASDESSYMTGSDLVIDGGWTAQ